MARPDSLRPSRADPATSRPPKTNSQAPAKPGPILVAGCGLSSLAAGVVAGEEVGDGLVPAAAAAAVDPAGVAAAGGGWVLTCGLPAGAARGGWVAAGALGALRGAVDGETAGAGEE
jgi:hypothetical protein